MIFCMTILGSCRSDKEEIAPDNKVSSLRTNLKDDQLKRIFGTALVNAFIDEPGIRVMIKEEALKRFNFDYEVLYHMVKHYPVKGEETFRDILLHYFDDVSVLEEIESQSPLLTIMIPELPENSFSAELWDAQSQIPAVALRIKSEKGVPILRKTYDGVMEEDYVPFNQIPGFPVVVIKDNERIEVSAKDDELTFSVPNETFRLRFTHANFDNRENIPFSKNEERFVFNPDPKLIQAKQYKDNDPNFLWHRDYIYYDLTPTNDRGPFNLDFRERLVSFTFLQGMSAYQHISQYPGDPAIYPGYISTNNSYGGGWTDGHFEFLVNALVDAKIGRPAIEPKFPASGDDLFDIEYEECGRDRCRWYHGCFGPDIVFYCLKSVTPKTFLPQRVDLMDWDLNVYAPIMTIRIEEIDNSQTITNVETSSSEFAANIKTDGGILKKIGIQFGVDGKVQQQSQRTVVTTIANNNLGETTVNFGNDVLLQYHGNFGFIPGKPSHLYSTREFSTGWVSVSVEPVRVQ